LPFFPLDVRQPPQPEKLAGLPEVAIEKSRISELIDEPGPFDTHVTDASVPGAEEQASSTHASMTIGEDPIVEGERIVGIVYNTEGQVGRLALPKLYDLIFTDRRLVGIVTVKTGGARIAGQLLGGVIGQAIAASVAKGGADKKRMAYAGMPLDQVAAQNAANFAAPWNTIENPRVKGLFSKRLEMRVGGKKAVFRLPKDQVPATQDLIGRQVPK
jgi:hypothetical protein